jgi:hypothetical protein
MTTPNVDNTGNGVKPDPFDPASLRLDQSFVATAGVKKLLNMVPVRKPNKQDFVRVHPDAGYRLSPAAIVELKEDREVYLIAPEVVPELVGEYVPATIYTAINRQKVLSLWPLRLPDANVKVNPWHQTIAEAAERAMTHWVRVSANMDLGAYDVFEAPSGLSEPEWPKTSFKELLKVAFRNHYVDSIDHPLVQRLHGLS